MRQVNTRNQEIRGSRDIKNTEYQVVGQMEQKKTSQDKNFVTCLREEIEQEN